jgi:hypothetical protein
MQTPKHGKRGKKRFHMTKRIGSTTYKVTIHFSQTSRETLDDKLIRLIGNEAQKGNEKP